MTKQTIGHAISESFVHAFRLIMAIGASLALTSAVVAWLLIGTLAQKTPETLGRSGDLHFTIC